MNSWGYRVCDIHNTDLVLLEDIGFETEADAELQGQMEAKVRNLKNWTVQTFQQWIDL